MKISMIKMESSTMEQSENSYYLYMKNCTWR